MRTGELLSLGSFGLDYTRDKSRYIIKSRGPIVNKVPLRPDEFCPDTNELKTVEVLKVCSPDILLLKDSKILRVRPTSDTRVDADGNLLIDHAFAALPDVVRANDEYFRANPTDINGTLDDADDSVVDVAVGEYHYAVLTRKGFVFTFGRNELGQLGLGHMRDTYTPTLVSKLVARPVPAEYASSSLAPRPFVPVVAISCGANHTLALAADGIVYSWGQADKGQTGTIANSMGVNSGAKLLSERGSTVHTVMRITHDLAQPAHTGPYTDDSLIQPQLPDQPQLQPPVLAPRMVAFPLITTESRLSTMQPFSTTDAEPEDGPRAYWEDSSRARPVAFRVCAIAAAHNLSACLSEDGRVFVFGSGLHLTHALPCEYEFPISDTDADTVPDAACSFAVRVAVGADHVLVLTRAGTLMGLGYAFHGQLPTHLRTLTPVALPEGLRVRDIACGAGASALVGEDGSLWVCGNNRAGRLGLPLGGAREQQHVRTLTSSAGTGRRRRQKPHRWATPCGSAASFFAGTAASLFTSPRSSPVRVRVVFTDGSCRVVRLPTVAEMVTAMRAAALTPDNDALAAGAGGAEADALRLSTQRVVEALMRADARVELSSSTTTRTQPRPTRPKREEPHADSAAAALRLLAQDRAMDKGFHTLVVAPSDAACGTVRVFTRVPLSARVAVGAVSIGACHSLLWLPTQLLAATPHMVCVRGGQEVALRAAGVLSHTHHSDCALELNVLNATVCTYAFQPDEDTDVDAGAAPVPTPTVASVFPLDSPSDRPRDNCYFLDLSSPQPVCAPCCDGRHGGALPGAEGCFVFHACAPPMPAVNTSNRPWWPFIPATAAAPVASPAAHAATPEGDELFPGDKAVLRAYAPPAPPTLPQRLHQALASTTTATVRVHLRIAAREHLVPVNAEDAAPGAMRVLVEPAWECYTSALVDLLSSTVRLTAPRIPAHTHHVPLPTCPPSCRTTVLLVDPQTHASVHMDMCACAAAPRPPLSVAIARVDGPFSAPLYLPTFDYPSSPALKDPVQPAPVPVPPRMVPAPPPPRETVATAATSSALALTRASRLIARSRPQYQRPVTPTQPARVPTPPRSSAFITPTACAPAAPVRVTIRADWEQLPLARVFVRMRALHSGAVVSYGAQLTHTWTLLQGPQPAFPPCLASTQQRLASVHAALPPPLAVGSHASTPADEPSPSDSWLPALLDTHSRCLSFLLPPLPAAFMRALSTESQPLSALYGDTRDAYAGPWPLLAAHIAAPPTLLVPEVSLDGGHTFTALHTETSPFLAATWAPLALAVVAPEPLAVYAQAAHTPLPLPPVLWAGITPTTSGSLAEDTSALSLTDMWHLFSQDKDALELATNTNTAAAEEDPALPADPLALSAMVAATAAGAAAGAHVDQRMQWLAEAVQRGEHTDAHLAELARLSDDGAVPEDGGVGVDVDAVMEVTDDDVRVVAASAASAAGSIPLAGGVLCVELANCTVPDALSVVLRVRGGQRAARVAQQHGYGPRDGLPTWRQRAEDAAYCRSLLLGSEELARECCSARLTEAVPQESAAGTDADEDTVPAVEEVFVRGRWEPLLEPVDAHTALLDAADEFQERYGLLLARAAEVDAARAQTRALKTSMTAGAALGKPKKTAPTPRTTRPAQSRFGASPPTSAASTDRAEEQPAPPRVSALALALAFRKAWVRARAAQLCAPPAPKGPRLQRTTAAASVRCMLAGEAAADFAAPEQPAAGDLMLVNGAELPANATVRAGRMRLVCALPTLDLWGPVSLEVAVRVHGQSPLADTPVPADDIADSTDARCQSLPPAALVPCDSVASLRSLPRPGAATGASLCSCCLVPPPQTPSGVSLELETEAVSSRAGNATTTFTTLSSSCAPPRPLTIRLSPPHLSSGLPLLLSAASGANVHLLGMGLPPTRSALARMTYLCDFAGATLPMLHQAAVAAEASQAATATGLGHRQGSLRPQPPAQNVSVRPVSRAEFLCPAQLVRERPMFQVHAGAMLGGDSSSPCSLTTRKAISATALDALAASGNTPDTDRYVSVALPAPVAAHSYTPLVPYAYPHASPVPAVPAASSPALEPLPGLYALALYPDPRRLAPCASRLLTLVLPPPALTHVFPETTPIWLPALPRAPLPATTAGIGHTLLAAAATAAQANSANGNAGQSQLVYRTPVSAPPSEYAYAHMVTLSGSNLLYSPDAKVRLRLILPSFSASVPPLNTQRKHQPSSTPRTKARLEDEAPRVQPPPPRVPCGFADTPAEEAEDAAMGAHGEAVRSVYVRAHWRALCAEGDLAAIAQTARTAALDVLRPAGSQASGATSPFPEAIRGGTPPHVLGMPNTPTPPAATTIASSSLLVVPPGDWTSTWAENQIAENMLKVCASVQQQRKSDEGRRGTTAGGKGAPKGAPASTATAGAGAAVLHMLAQKGISVQPAQAFALALPPTLEPWQVSLSFAMPPLTAFGPLRTDLLQAWLAATGLTVAQYGALAEAYDAAAAESLVDAEEVVRCVQVYSNNPALLTVPSPPTQQSARGGSSHSNHHNANAGVQYLPLSLAPETHPRVAEALAGLVLTPLTPPATGTGAAASANANTARQAEADRWQLIQLGPSAMLCKCSMRVDVSVNGCEYVDSGLAVTLDTCENSVPQLLQGAHVAMAGLGVAKEPPKKQKGRH